MVSIYHEQSGQAIGEITDGDFQFLTTSLEEESASDDNYYVDQPTVELLRNSGASAALIEVLERAVSTYGATEIKWRESGTEN